jgi:hypothetical protein
VREGKGGVCFFPGKHVPPLFGPGDNPLSCQVAPENAVCRIRVATCAEPENKFSSLMPETRLAASISLISLLHRGEKSFVL